MLKIFRYLKGKDWAFIAASVVFIVAQVWLDLKLPDYMKQITLLVQTPGSAMADIWIQGGWMLLCALGSLASSVVVGFFASRVAANFSKNLRAATFRKVEGFSMEEVNGFSTASLITRSTNDITQIQMIIAMGLQVLIKAPIMAIWAITKISSKAWQWTLATGITVVVLVAMILVIMAFVLPKFKKIQKLTDNLNGVTRENLTGIRVVHAYNAEAFQERKFEKANDDLTKNHLFTMRIMAIMNSGMSLLMNGLTLSIFWIGIFVINAAGLEAKLDIFGDMTVFSMYAMQVVMAFMLLTMIFIMLPRASVSAKRINDVLSTETKIKDGEGAEGKTSGVGEIEFRNVSFRYPNAAEDVLTNVSFTAHKGETVAFIGSTGSGKSTLINLVPRFYDATEGEILIDGVNVKDYKLKELHNKLGYIPQKAVLFSGTVASNVSYGDNGKEPASEEQIKRAVAVAQATDFVEKKEGGYDSFIAQGGTNVSGGQKQRLSIARAVCKNPEIYIFDDSFSALDYKTDRELRGALKNETADATTLIVAQRIGTIKDADKILVLDEGKVVGTGTHRELLDSCEIYREIALSQLSEEELYA